MLHTFPKKKNYLVKIIRHYNHEQGLLVPYLIALSNGNMLSFSFSVESGAQRAEIRYESSRKWQRNDGGHLSSK